MSAMEVLLGAAANLALAALALARRSLTPLGALAGVVVGLGIFWSGGLQMWLLLALFFVSSTLWSRLGREAKREAEGLTGKGERRDAVQVLANGGPALLTGILGRLSGEPAFAVATAAALAAANADTWASEIGLLSRRAPVSLLGFRPMDRGESGGVTALGLLASLGGAALIAAPLALFGGGTAGALIVASCGLLGSVVDSLLGSTIQGRFRSANGSYTERGRSPSGGVNVRSSGLRLVTNDAVNLLSGLIASGTAAALALHFT